jgi:adenylylsulfate kinase
MKNLADFEKKHGRMVICDFVCPTKKTKENFDPDITIWMNTIKEGRYEDTNKMFEEPSHVHFRITEMNDSNHEKIAKELLSNV